MFTISGTSGGALGAASFVAAIDARRQAQLRQASNWMQQMK